MAELGEGARHSVVERALEAAFPNLTGTKYEITSAATEAYNCIAWAAAATDRWWWPDSLGDEYWPEASPRLATISAFSLAFQDLGYLPCTNAALEPGYERIAIYAREDGTPTHAARQLPTGQWTSKLGAREDIVHETPESLAGTIYGDVVLILRRQLS